jgi:hypothetical protein
MPSMVCWVLFLACFGFLVLAANHWWQVWTLACKL